MKGYLSFPLRSRPDYGECNGSPDQPSYCAAVPRGYDPVKDAEDRTRYDVVEFKQDLVRLGHVHPSLRPHLRPIIRHVEVRTRHVEAANRLDQIRGEPGRMRELLRVREDETIEDRYTPQRAVQRLVDEVGEREAAGMINYVANFTQKDYFLRMQEELPRVDET